MVRWLIWDVFLSSIESLRNAVRNYARPRSLCTDVQTGTPLPSHIVAAHGHRDIRCRALDVFAPGSYALSPLRGGEDERTLFSPQLFNEEDWESWDPDFPSTVD